MYSTINESEVFAFYIIRNENGEIVAQSSQVFIWKDMWNNFRAALTIPQMPDTAGNYKVEIYLNGAQLGILDFEIVE